MLGKDGCPGATDERELEVRKVVAGEQPSQFDGNHREVAGDVADRDGEGGLSAIGNVDIVNALAAVWQT